MVSKKKIEEIANIEHESEQILGSMKDSMDVMRQLVAEDGVGKTREQVVKEKIKMDRQVDEYSQKREYVILSDFRAGGVERLSYLKSQIAYYKFFAYSPETKQDTIVLNYRK